MKRLLSLIGSIAIVGSGASAVISCGDKQSNNFEFKDLATYTNQQKQLMGKYLASALALESNQIVQNKVTIAQLQAKYTAPLEGALMRALQTTSGLIFFTTTGAQKTTIKTIEQYVNIKLASTTGDKPLQLNDVITVTISAKPKNPLGLKNSLSFNFKLNNQFDLSLLPKIIVTTIHAGDPSPYVPPTPTQLKQDIVDYIKNWLTATGVPSSVVKTVVPANFKIEISLPKNPIPTQTPFPVTIQGKPGTLFSTQKYQTAISIGYNFNASDDGKLGVTLDAANKFNPKKFTFTVKNLEALQKILKGVAGDLVEQLNGYIEKQVKQGGESKLPQKVTISDFSVDTNSLIVQLHHLFFSQKGMLSLTIDLTKIKFFNLVFEPQNLVGSSLISLNVNIS